MSRSSKWLSAPRRLWRRRGHGVHSPYAYDFLRRIIAQPCSYYADEELDRLAREQHATPRLARLLYRLCMHVKPHRVVCYGAEAATLARLVTPLLPPDIAPTNTGSGTVILATGADIDRLTDVWTGMDCGQLFRGSSAAILIGYRHLYHQKFDIWI